MSYAPNWIQAIRVLWLSIAALVALTPPISAQSPAVQYDCVMDPVALIHVSASTPGVLDAVLVRRGDKVTKGQIIAQVRSVIESETINILETRAGSSAAVDAQRARVLFSNGRVERARQLLEENALSLSQLEEFEYDYTTAETLLQKALLDKEFAAGELARARTSLEQTNIRSPVDGYVLETTLEPGEYATGERHVMRIVQLDPLLIEAFLPIELYPTTSVGQAVTVRPALPISGQYTTTITVVDRVFDTASRTFGVRAELSNPDGALPAGLRCLLDISLPATTTVAPHP